MVLEDEQLQTVKVTRRREATREKILDAALALVAKNGPENLTLTDVVRHSGVHRATIYQHFATRDDVLAASSERFASKFYKEVLVTMKAQDEILPGGKALVNLTNAFAEFVMHNPDLAQIWLHTLVNSKEPAKDPVWQEYEGSVRRMIESDVAQEGLDSEALSILILSGTMFWPLWTRAHTKTEAQRTNASRRFTGMLFRVALRGIVKPEFFPGVTDYVEATKSKKKTKKAP